MSGKRSRTKGANWERKVANDFKEIMPGCGARRGLQFQGGVVPDVDVVQFWPECKVGKAPPLLPALNQARRDLKEAEDLAGSPLGRIPIAIVKRNAKSGHEKPEEVVVIGYSDFKELIKEWWERGQA